MSKRAKLAKIRAEFGISYHIRDSQLDRVGVTKLSRLRKQEQQALIVLLSALTPPGSSSPVAAEPSTNGLVTPSDGKTASSADAARFPASEKSTAARKQLVSRSARRTGDKTPGPGRPPKRPRTTSAPRRATPTPRATMRSSSEGSDSASSSSDETSTSSDGSSSDDDSPEAAAAPRPRDSRSSRKATAGDGASCALCRHGTAKYVLADKRVVKGAPVADALGPVDVQSSKGPVHLMCAAWSPEVLTAISVPGALSPSTVSTSSLPLDIVERAVKRGVRNRCKHCGRLGATLGCFKPRCQTNVHVACALIIAATDDPKTPEYVFTAEPKGFFCSKDCLPQSGAPTVVASPTAAPETVTKDLSKDAKEAQVPRRPKAEKEKRTATRTPGPADGAKGSSEKEKPSRVKREKTDGETDITPAKVPKSGATTPDVKADVKEQLEDCPLHPGQHSWIACPEQGYY